MENVKRRIGKEIISEVLKYVGVNAPTFANRIGVNYQRINDLQTGKVQKVSQDLANKIMCAYPQLDMRWLLTGEGSMLRDGGYVVQNNRDGDNIHGNNVNVDKSEAALLELLKKKDEQIDKLLGIIEKLNK